MVPEEKKQNREQNSFKTIIQENFWKIDELNINIKGPLEYPGKVDSQPSTSRYLLEKLLDFE